MGLEYPVSWPDAYRPPRTRRRRFAGVRLVRRLRTAVARGARLVRRFVGLFEVRRVRLLARWGSSSRTILRALTATRGGTRRPVPDATTPTPRPLGCSTT